MELGEFIMLSMEIKNTIVACPFLLQIKSMMELGKFQMLSIEMKNNLLTLSPPASD
jgi:hypothetical protein